MNIETVVAVGIRLAGIFIAFTQLEILAFQIISVSQSNSGNYQPFLLLSFPMLLCAVILIIAPSKISQLVLTGIETGTSEKKLSLEGWQTVVFAGMGIFFIAKTAITFSIMLINKIFHDLPFLLRSSDIVILLLQILVGFWLLTGAIGLRRIVRKFRNAGLQ